MKRFKLALSSIITLMLVVLSGCTAGEYKPDISECNYNNGAYAFKYDDTKLSVGIAMDWGDVVMGSVDIISDKVITGDSLIGIYVQRGVSCTEEDIADYMKDYTTKGFNITEMSDIESLSYTDHSMIVGELHFKTTDKSYIVKGFSKWNTTFLCIAELLNDSEYNDSFIEVCNSFTPLGYTITDTESVMTIGDVNEDNVKGYSEEDTFEDDVNYSE